VFGLLNTKPGPFDLRWRMFGTPIRVKPMFWLMMALFGWGLASQKGFVFLLIWVLAGFLSVLFHEMGHITAGRAFGYPGVIILFALGGGAIGEYLKAKRWQRIIIALAGPAGGLFLFLGACIIAPWVVSYLAPRLGPYFDHVMSFLGYLGFMGLFWTFFNLFPILPQDGGMVMKECLTAVLPRFGERLAYFVSFLVAAGIAVYAYLSRGDTDYTSLDYFFEVLFRRFSHILAIYRGRLEPTFAMVMYAILAVMSLFNALRPNRPAEPEAPPS
jgi:Zn-dependent protease